MMKKIVLTLLSLAFIQGLFSQRVGVNTNTPTNTMHIIPLSGTEPIRIEGLTSFQVNDTLLLVTDTATGVVRSISYTDLILLIQNRIDTDIDSMRFANDTLYLYEDNQVVTANIYLDTALVDSLIYSKFDSAYHFITDSSLRDSIYIATLDSLLNQITDTLYFNDTSFTRYRDSLLGDSLFIDSIRSGIIDTDTDVDSVNYINDTLYIYENGSRVGVYLSFPLDTNFVDSLIYTKVDSFYTYISDSLILDTTILRILQDSIETLTYFNQLHDSTIYYVDENGDTSFVNLKSLVDSVETLTYFNQLHDSTIYYVDENGDSSFVNLKSLVDSIETLTYLNQLDDSTIFYVDENGDTTFVNLKSLIDSVETLTYLNQLNDSTIYYVDENGDTTFVNLKSLIDSVETLTYFNQLDDSTIYYVDENGDTTFVNLSFVDSIETLTYFNTINDSAIFYVDENGDTTFVNLQRITDSLMYEKLDSFYRYIADSLILDTTWLNAVKDSIDSDVDSLTLTSDTTLNLFEDNKTISLDLRPFLDSLRAKEPWRNASDGLGANQLSTDIYYDNGNVGIGLSNPNKVLHIDAGGDSLRIDNLAKGTLGNVLMHDTLTGRIISGSITDITYLDVTTISANATATIDQQVILVNVPSIAGVTLNLPTAVGNTGKQFYIKKISGSILNILTIDPLGGQTIDGAATQTVSTNNNGYVIVSNGANWFIIGSF